MTLRQKIVLWHVLACAIFMLQPILLPTQPLDNNGGLTSPLLLQNFGANALLIAFFYGNYFAFIPRFYYTKQYVVYGLCALGSLVVIVAAPQLLMQAVDFGGPSFMPPPPPFDLGPPGHPDSPFAQLQQGFSEVDHQVFLFVAIVLFSLALRIRERLYESEKARHRAEVSFLMAQINPHFLFNALNSIYALTIREHASKSSDGILTLSGMMRYVLTDTSHSTVSLQKEIDYIRDYIEFQKLRLDNGVRLDYQCNAVVKDLQIAPLLLIPFIENAFKHGINPDEDSKIKIEIDVHENRLLLRVINNRVNSTVAAIEKTGLGIENTKNRLQLMYPSKHKLEIIELPAEYRVELQIDLQ